jgi:hypothetical protein
MATLSKTDAEPTYTVMIVLLSSGTEDITKLNLCGVTGLNSSDSWISAQDGDGVIWNIPTANVAYTKIIPEPVKEESDAD